MLFLKSHPLRMVIGATSTWVGGSVPGASDAVVIAHNVTCAGTQSCLQLTVVRHLL